MRSTAAEKSAATVAAILPAYEPGERLRALADRLRESGFGDVIVIDDGSSEACQPVFESLRSLPGVVVLRHPRNLGKGQALKTGFQYFLDHFPQGTGVVTVDADGQHLASDAAKLARAMTEDPESFVLGVRAFTGPVPLRSRFGNSLTRALVTFWAGQPVRDTQCGLRAISRQLLPALIATRGDRYEFEMNSLLRVLRSGVPLRQVEVSTVYLDGNSSSHFRAIRDSMRIYAVLGRFYFSSFAASVVDLGLFSLLMALGSSLLASVVAARVVSSLFNFAVNRALVFQSGARPGADLVKYYGLAAFVLAASYLLTRLLVSMGSPVLGAKIAVDASLSLASFAMQRGYVFARGR